MGRSLLGPVYAFFVINSGAVQGQPPLGSIRCGNVEPSIDVVVVVAAELAASFALVVVIVEASATVPPADLQQKQQQCSQQVKQ